jgi:hypothetical protein
MQTESATHVRGPGSLISESLKPSGRQTIADQSLATGSHVTGAMDNRLFQRLIAKEVTFENVRFKYSIFEACYLRSCRFIKCDFTGCRFLGCNMLGSSFDGCRFDYAFFERTHAEPDILNSCPGFENLKRLFVRTLRTNFQAIGDPEAVNQAIAIELLATEEHLLKSWNAPEAYYRGKHRGWDRFKMFLKYVGFKLMDWVWGNGESTWKLLRALVVTTVFLAIYHVFLTHKPIGMLKSYFEAFFEVPAIFFGITTPTDLYQPWLLTIIMIVRLIFVGFLLSIIIKRFSRR